MSKLFSELFQRCESGHPDPTAHHQMEKLAHAHDPQALNYVAVSAFLEKLTFDKKHWDMLHQAAEQGIPAARHNLLLLEILFHKKRFDDNAVKDFVHFADKNHLSDAWLNLGSLFYSAHNDYPAAEACLAHLPEDPAALFQRGIINEKEGNVLGALAFYWEATLGYFEPAKAHLSELAIAAQLNDHAIERQVSKRIENHLTDPALKSSYRGWQEMLAAAASSEERQVITSYFLPHFAGIAKASQRQELVKQFNQLAKAFYFEPAVLVAEQRLSLGMR